MNKQDLLLQPVWDYHDVMEYCGVKKSKAFEIIKVCKTQLNGTVRFNKHGVKRDSVLEYMGSDIERETYILKQLEKQEDNQEMTDV